MCPSAANTRLNPGTSAGPTANAAAVPRNCTRLGPPKETRYFCCIVLLASGPVLTWIPRHGKTPLSIPGKMRFPRNVTRSSLLNVTLQSIYDPCANPRLNKTPLHFPYYRRGALRNAPRHPSRFSVMPRRHNHGSTLPDHCQIPRRSFRASCSRAASRNSRLQYLRYHHAQPSLIMISFTRHRSPFLTFATALPYLSMATTCTDNGCFSSNVIKALRDPLNPICPCSGASNPHRRTRTVSPYMLRKSIVSPSHT